MFRLDRCDGRRDGDPPRAAEVSVLHGDFHLLLGECAQPAGTEPAGRPLELAVHVRGICDGQTDLVRAVGAHAGGGQGRDGLEALLPLSPADVRHLRPHPVQSLPRRPLQSSYSECCSMTRSRTMPCYTRRLRSTDERRRSRTRTRSTGRRAESTSSMPRGRQPRLPGRRPTSSRAWPASRRGCRRRKTSWRRRAIARQTRQSPIFWIKSFMKVLAGGRIGSRAATGPAGHSASSTRRIPPVIFVCPDREITVPRPSPRIVEVLLETPWRPSIPSSTGER